MISKIDLGMSLNCLVCFTDGPLNTVARLIVAAIVIFAKVFLRQQGFSPLCQIVWLCKYRLTGCGKPALEIESPQAGQQIRFRNKNQNTKILANELMSMLRVSNGNKGVSLSSRPKSKKQYKQKRLRSLDRLNAGLHPAALTRVNPFLSACDGCRSPDDFGYPTGTAVIRSSVTIASDANGVIARAYLPFINGFQFAPAIVTAGTVTWGGGSFLATPQAASLMNLASAYRVVGWGIRITTDSALTTTSGHMWISHCPINLSATSPYFDFPVNEGGFTQLPLAEKFSMVEMAERPVIVPGRQFDSGIDRFRTTSTAEVTLTGVGLESTLGWCGALFYATGLPASTASLNVEFIMHIEYVHDGASAYGFVDTVPEPYDLAAKVQISDASLAMPVGVVETVVSNVESAASFIERLSAAATKLRKPIAMGAYAAANLAQMRGYLRGPAASPFAQISY